MPTVQSHGARIHYLTLPCVDKCPQDARCVVFVHGGGGNAQTFYHQMPFFASRGFYAISLSVRGFGSSALDADDASLFSASHFSKDVVAVLDACGVQKAAVVGHSIGGFYVARMCMDAPERLTHAVFSSTFYGLVDHAPAGQAPQLTRYLDHPYCTSGRDDVAVSLRDHIPDGAEVAASLHPRVTHPSTCDLNLSEAFRRRHPNLAWLSDSTNDTNTEVARLALKKRFRLIHEASATPAQLRRRFRGPVLFTTTECDAAVHWEIIYYLASQFKEQVCAGLVALHWFRGPLCHAPYVEEPIQFNQALLDFFDSSLPMTVAGPKPKRSLLAVLAPRILLPTLGVLVLVVARGALCVARR